MVVSIIDDDEAVVDSLRALLESYGLRTSGYTSARDFLARSDDPPTRCIVVDMHMPEMSGLELLGQLKARGTMLPAVMITGRGEENLAERAARLGAAGVLRKPVDDAVLVNLIREIMGNDK